MAYTLAEAARAIGRNKTTVLRAIKNGKISGVRDEVNGGWLVEPAELHRLYPAASDAADRARDAARRSGDAATDSRERGGDAVAELRELRVKLAATEVRIADKDAVIEALRRRLDAADEERRLTLRPLATLLTDRRPGVPFWRRWWQRR